MAVQVLVLRGDGIGPEVTDRALAVFEAVAASGGIEIETSEGLIGGCAIEETGTALPDESFELAKRSDAILMGSVGGPQWDHLPILERPERGLLRLRRDLDLFANLRPAKIYGDLVEASTLKREVVEGADLMVIRELTGGIYFGEPRGISGADGARIGQNTMVYREDEIERIVKTGFDIAGKRRRRLCSVDKANVLEVSVLWREVATRLAPQFPDIELEHLYVDNASMQLIRAPKHFDTIVTGNMFGDILSDVAAMLTGSSGMLPSASVGERYALYEPVHGSAPDIAGQDIANPLAAILSVGMMFRYSFDRGDLDDRIADAVIDVLSRARTVDIMSEGKRQVGCREMGDLVLEQLAGQKPPQPIPTRA
ncbi:MAG: 3-isopropylmalate dehydrogenase [SAR324 cluster bacterium]|nr:3-isopropylmalate dehydrogenase [SAR324 cluster bacterium]